MLLDRCPPSNLHAGAAGRTAGSTWRKTWCTAARALGRLQLEVEAVVALEPKHRRLRRAEQAHVRGSGPAGPHVSVSTGSKRGRQRAPANGAAVSSGSPAADDQPGQALVRRIVVRPAVRQLRAHERAGNRAGAARAMLGCSGVNVCTSTWPPRGPRPVRPATWASKLKRPLRGAEVGDVQADVGVDHADQRHVREVEPLGDHLRAEQDVDQAACGRPSSTRAWLPGRRIVSLSMRRTT